VAVIAASRPSLELRRERRVRLGREPRRRRGLRSTGVQLLYLLAAVALGLVVPQVPIGFTVASDRAIEPLVAVGELDVDRIWGSARDASRRRADARAARCQGVSLIRRARRREFGCGSSSVGDAIR
jgi:hypothetical protein